MRVGRFAFIGMFCVSNDIPNEYFSVLISESMIATTKVNDETEY